MKRGDAGIQSPRVGFAELGELLKNPLGVLRPGSGRTEVH